MLSYIMSIFVLIMGFGLFMVGKLKSNEQFKNIGIGILLSFILLEIPDLIKGFEAGFNTN